MKKKEETRVTSSPVLMNEQQIWEMNAKRCQLNPTNAGWRDKGKCGPSFTRMEVGELSI